MLTDTQIYVIAILATILTYAIKALAKTKVKINNGWVTAIVYVIAGILAVAWSAPAFPPFPQFTDIATFTPALIGYASAIMTLLGPIVAFATLIYNVLGKKVLDGLAARIEQARTPQQGG